MSRRHRLFLTAAACVVMMGGARAGAQNRPGDTCQILDATVDPLWAASLSVVPNSELEGHGETGVLELDATAEFAYFRDVRGGNVDMDFVVNVLLFTDSAGIEMPNQLAEIAVDVGWAGKYGNGYGWLTRIAPGMYSDLESVGSGSFNAPLTLAGVYAVDASLSVLLGADIRFGFELPVMPRLGVAWEISDTLRLAAQLPESDLTWYVNDLWSAHAGFAWNNMSYELREKGGFERKQLTVEDYRFWVGAARRVSAQFQVAGDLGWTFNRSLEFEKDEPSRGIKGPIDVEDQVFLRVALTGPF